MATLPLVRTVAAPTHRTDLFLLLLLVGLMLGALVLEKQRILEQQAQLLNQHLVEVNKQLDRLLFFPKVLASDPRFIAVLQNNTAAAQAQANVLLEEMTHSSGAAVIYIMNPQGETIAAGNWRGEDTFVGENYSFRPYFRDAIRGQQATYYAVGATTGQPGFFIANPIFHADALLGVIVVKIHLESLQDSWGRLEYDIALFDDLDVAILSSRDDFLYVPFGDLPEATLAKITAEKRYQLRQAAEFVRHDTHRLTFVNGQRRGYLSVSQPTAPVPWRIRLFYPMHRYWQHVALYAAVLMGVTLLMYLLLRLFRQQRFIAQVERHHAQELEAKVAERTTQLRSAQQQLIIQSNYAMLGKMSAAINHEINQPLTSLRFNLASLRQLLEQQPVPHDMVNQIAVESDLTTKRISRVMETLRSVSKTANTDFDRIDLEALIQDTFNAVRRERPNVSRCLRTEVNVNGIHVRGNFVLLQQAILNLLANGFDAVMACDAPCIILSVDTAAHHAIVSVTDNGVGVSRTMTTRLFDEYATGKSGKKGLGLGLALSNQIAIDHGGRLTYASVDSGGSRFSIELPLEHVLKEESGE